MTNLRSGKVTEEQALPLADLLRSFGAEIGRTGADGYRLVVARNLISNAGDLLAALAAAGVLRHEGFSESPCCADPACGHSRYVSEWEDST